MLLQALEPPHNRSLPLPKHKARRQVRAAAVRRDVSTPGKGSGAVLVEFLKALKSSSLNRGREQSIFLKLGFTESPVLP